MAPGAFPFSLTGGGAGPSGADGITSSGFDSSGWAVNFGAGSASAAGSSGDLGKWAPYILAGVGLLIVWRASRKR